MVDPREGRWFKGVPQGHAHLELDAIKGAGYCLLRDELMLPAAVLKRSALDQNERFMSALLSHYGLDFAPHAKTTMSPEIIRRQLSAGAWAITAATAHHVRAYVAWGVRRIILANELVGAANIAAVFGLLQEARDLELYALVDSIDGLEQLCTGARIADARKPLKLLLEIGGDAQRAGVRTLSDALEIARACEGRAEVSLCGVEAFEGVYQAAVDARHLLERLGGVVRALDAEGLFAAGEIVLSAGGTALFDVAAQGLLAANLAGRARLVHRSGCYVTHDSAQYERAFEAALGRDPSLAALGRPGAALEVWAHIQSRPERGRVIASLGKRDVGTDVELPRPLWLYSREDGSLRALSGEIRADRIFDQHLCLGVPDDWEGKVGDLVGFGVSHPCTTFDRWRALFMVNDEYVVTDVVRTFF